MQKKYSQAPLPFMGQKRMFAAEFRRVLAQFDDDTVFVDLFGGSGLLSHIAKRDHERWQRNETGNFVRNKRSVWTVSTKPEREAHFACFPQNLIVDCIKAGCPEGGIVLDPFMGSGTTAVVARKLNRNYIGFELNPEYIKIADRKLKMELGIFA